MYVMYYGINDNFQYGIRLMDKNNHLNHLNDV